MLPLRALAIGCGCLLLSFARLIAQQAPADAATTAGIGLVIRQDIPDKIDPAARYLIYLHGAIIEDKGVRPTDPKYGTYEFMEIVQALERKGFTVITESRPKGTDAKEYARTVVAQIHTLLKAGVPPNRISVVGASKGSVIAMIASTALKNREVNFVIMANCNDWLMRTHQIDLHGNVLSIYDVNDEFGRTCQPFFEKATGLGRRKEVELKIGTGHAILYQPLPEWIDLVEQWANQTD
ncbi:MAG TPA: alpha/beta hydrolase [Chthoniobacterales bacterium]